MQGQTCRLVSALNYQGAWLPLIADSQIVRIKDMELAKFHDISIHKLTGS